MTSRTSRPTTTILVLVPLVAVPLLAVFGIPQFAPVSASQSYEFDEFDFETRFEPSGNGTGSSTGAPRQPDVRSAYDLFAPFPDSRDAAVETAMSHGRFASGDGASGQEWEDLFSPPGGRPAREHGHSADPRFARDGLPPTHDRRPAGREGPRSGFPGFQDFSEQNAPEVESRTPAGRQTAQAERRGRSRPRPTRPDAFTWQDAVQRLKDLSINHYRLEPGVTDNEFVFRCRFTPEDNPRVTYLLEAEAAEPLRAVQKVLAEIDELLESRRTTAVLVR